MQFGPFMMIALACAGSDFVPGSSFHGDENRIGSWVK
jgi:hypothetical protein